MKEIPESQIAALKAHNTQKNHNTIARVNQDIDNLKENNSVINFETVAKAAGVSRATLYNNPMLKERIMGLRSISHAPFSEDKVQPKEKVQRLEDTVVALRARVRQLETDKKNLIIQLVDYEETKAENERLKRQLLKGVSNEE